MFDIEKINIDELYEAIKQASIDMHLPSLRPCETCRKMSDVIGELYGCYAYQKSRRTKNV